VSDSAWMIYGAGGHTGGAIAREAVARGMRPILAGRNAAKIEALAAELGCESRVFPLTDDPAQTARHLAGVATVLHCAGPFSATSRPMIEACLRAGAHYLDITGEIAVIEAAAAYHRTAQEAGVSLIPAVGFDVVATDCLAAMLAREVPHATHLQLAFTLPRQVTPGTARTVLEGLAAGGRARIDGRIVKVPIAWKSMAVPFRGGTQRAVTVPWGDVASAWYTTGIGNIEVYLALPKLQIAVLRGGRWLVPLLKFRPLRSLLSRAIQRVVRSTPSRGGQTGGASLWGRVRDAEGRSAEATLETPDGYLFTVLSALASVDRVSAGASPPGFSTPATAFGPDFVLTLPGTDFRRE